MNYKKRKGEKFMDNLHLGIASVPCQNWGELFTPEEALMIGTIFKELDKPFFAADALIQTLENTPQNSISSQQDDRECLLSKINQVSFVLDDLTLYLDTHPKDQNALQMFTEFSKKRDLLKKDFAKKHYPLTRDCLAECKVDHDGFCWQEGPIPWEGACI